MVQLDPRVSFSQVGGAPGAREGWFCRVGTCGGGEAHVEFVVSDAEEMSHVEDVIVGELKDVVDEHTETMVQVLDSDQRIVEIAISSVALLLKLKENQWEILKKDENTLKFKGLSFQAILSTSLAEAGPSLAITEICLSICVMGSFRFSLAQVSNSTAKTLLIIL